MHPLHASAVNAGSVSANEPLPERAATPDAATWRRLHEAASLEDFAQAWLALQCLQLQGARAACVVLGAPEAGPYLPLAFWPDAARGSAAVIASTELALHERRGVLRDPAGGAAGAAQRGPASCFIALPLLVDQRLHGAVAVELLSRSDAELADAMRTLQWGCAWIEARLRRDAAGRFNPAQHRLAWLLEGVAASVDATSQAAAVSAFVTQMATQLGCERVSLGWQRGQRIEVAVLSHSAQFAQRSDLVDGIAALMNEAADQARTLVLPAPPQSALGLLAHDRYSQTHGSCALCTVPLVQGGRIIGALSLERAAERPFEKDSIEYCEAAAALAGPLLDIRRRADRSWFGHLADGAKALREQLRRPGLNASKGALAAALLLALFGLFAQGTYRISADTHVEGLVQRVVAAPVNGYVLESRARAGDEVKQGQLLARLDDRDLLLERSKWTSQRRQHEQEMRDALARGSRAEVEVLRAQVGAAEAELALVEERLARSQIVAPLDGVVVSGDLSRALGSPVTQGEVLFKVAPLHAYRVVLEVDERDMEGVQVGVPGRLVLTGRADAVLALHVDKVTPVAEARDGRNFFRVEAKLDTAPDFLRPGMRGVGKLDLGQERYVWIWTRTLVNAWRLALWGWL